jgi:hypothetical protein
MLRFDYMPSDFQPIFLFLGDADDLSALAGVLRRFAKDQKEISVSEAIPNSKSRTGLTLARAEVEFGMREVNGSFKWLLNTWQAEQIAGRIDLLTPADHKSGSDVFEVGSEGEVPVKVSRGEFTDDYLVSKL